MMIYNLERPTRLRYKMSRVLCSGSIIAKFIHYLHVNPVKPLDYPYVDRLACSHTSFSSIYNR